MEKNTLARNDYFFVGINSKGKRSLIPVSEVRNLLKKGKEESFGKQIKVYLVSFLGNMISTEEVVSISRNGLKCKVESGKKVELVSMHPDYKKFCDAYDMCEDISGHFKIVIYQGVPVFIGNIINKDGTVDQEEIIREIVEYDLKSNVLTVQDPKYYSVKYTIFLNWMEFDKKETEYLLSNPDGKIKFIIQGEDESQYYGFIETCITLSDIPKIVMTQDMFLRQYPRFYFDIQFFEYWPEEEAFEES